MQIFGVRNLVVSSPALRRTTRKLVFLVRPGARRWYQQLDECFQDARWADVVSLVEASIDEERWFMTPNAYAKLAQSHVRLGAHNSAHSSLVLGCKAYPSSAVLARAKAELLMVTRKFPEALEAWSQFDLLDDPGEESFKPFPLRGTDFIWFEQAWSSLAEHRVESASTGESTSELSAGTRARTLTRVVETLRALKMNEQALTLAGYCLKEFPNEARVVPRLFETVLRIGDFDSVEDASKSLGLNASGPEAQAYSERLVASVGMFDQLLEQDLLAEGDFRILSLQRDSGAAAAVFANGVWTDDRIHREAIRLSRRDIWPEGTSSVDRVSEAAWLDARRFARRRGRELGIEDVDLARAVFHHIKHEIILKLPTDRIAEEIARTYQGGPVFINLGSLQVNYLLSYPGSKFRPIYLYDALRRKGLPVYFVRFPQSVAGKKRRRLSGGSAGPVFRARSTGQGLKPKPRAAVDLPDDTTQLVVTSGIRSVDGLLREVGDAVVLNSGSALKSYAYDRSFRQNWGYDTHESVHPRGGLTTFHVATEFKRTWTREAGKLTQAGPGLTEESEATLAIGAWPEGSWHDNLYEAVMPYFSRLVDRTRGKLELLGTTDVHIGDYLYAEPALVSAVAKEQGAKVHIWPHSSNPVHVKWHAHERLASVRAVTRTGAEQWEKYVPSKNVLHDPHLLLLGDQVNEAEWTDGMPVSLVLIGGRPVMRDLPILNLAAHEELYREFFQALTPLVAEGKLKIYFKPRGLSGENEGWLESVVGRVGQWRPILDHPLRISLPNPVFGAVSVASTALLEGVSRGVPSFIVRNGSVRDYLAVADGTVAVFDVEQATKWIASLTDAESWKAAQRVQRQWLERELSVGE